MSQLASPLFLSLFCKATNPERKKLVGLERIPRSLTAVFEKYREVVVSRAAEALNIAHHDVESALQQVGLALWDENARTFDFDRLRELVGDRPRAWSDSLARVLEEEGVLAREPIWHIHRIGPNGHPEGNQVSTIMYDAFAGFVIADAILTQHGHHNFPDWISENWEAFDTSRAGHHPLAEDILKALVGILACRHNSHLWKNVPSPVREKALLETTNLEAERIDDETISELSHLSKNKETIGRHNIFFQLSSRRALVNHPLNSEFLHNVLLEMDVSQRDLLWTEWLRKNRKRIVTDLERLERRWIHNNERNTTDRLFARWTSWTLTSTVRYLRDQATKTLYWYGLRAPKEFFELAIDSLALNDPSVPERMFAAAYGVVMGMQCAVDKVRMPLEWFLKKISEKLSGEIAETPTNHWMLRAYVQGIVDFAKHFAPETIPDNLLDSVGCIKLASAEFQTAKVAEDDLSVYLGHDFENYTIGRLFSDRRRYDFNHETFNITVNEIKKRVWELGWNENEFKEIDNEIAQSRHYYTHRHEPSKTERYAKKYGWIGFYEKAGALTNAKQLSCKFRHGNENPIVDIDPSFPQVPPKLPLRIPSWTAQSPEANKDWLEKGEIIVPDKLLRTQELGDYVTVHTP